MKVLLEIGGSVWKCDSAIKAAKITDLLGDCVPVHQIYEAGSSPEVYLEKADHSHRIKIEEVTDKMLFTSSQAKVTELVKVELAHRNPKEVKP